MSIFKKITTALGYKNEQDYDDPLVEIQEKVSAVAPHIESDEPIEVSEEMMIKIFEKVVEVTTASLPGYLPASVNAEKQEK